MCTMAKVFVDIILKFILSTPSFNLVLFVFYKKISSYQYQFHINIIFIQKS